MPTVKIINDDDSIASTLTTSTTSDSPCRSRPSLRRRDIHLQCAPDRRARRRGGAGDLRRRRTIDDISSWVSQRLSVRHLAASRKDRTADLTQRGTDADSYYTPSCTDSDDEALTDSYAAFCRAFTAGHPEYNDSYRHGHYQDRSPWYGRRYYHFVDVEKTGEGGHVPEETDPPIMETMVCSTVDGAYPCDRAGGSGQSSFILLSPGEDHTTSSEFSPQNAHAHAPHAAPPPISPPPRILTPAIYAETQRAAARQWREQSSSQDGRRSARESRWVQRWKSFQNWWRHIGCW
ncbi:hypothetical protein BDV59DRAFT_199316 [Aspergillus ambiguus]|uniref:uncharacterized protein n=1 Tax=Aspergillus ambiguus TaxID=176160 RepID=UPI003CCCD43C